MVNYVKPETFKDTVSIPDTTTDSDVDTALAAASRAVEKVTQRRFWLDESSVERTYTAISGILVVLDDVTQIDSVVSDGTTIAAADYDAFPLNAAADNEPFLWLESNAKFSTKRAAITVTGRFGWPQIPDQVPQIVTIVASKLLKRAREAPWGIVSTGGVEGTALRITREDPDLLFLVGALRRHHPVVA